MKKVKEEYIYKGTVKNIALGTWAKTSGHHDSFEMDDMIGKRIKLYARPEKNWYVGEDGYSYHSSWLKNLRKIKLSPTSKV